MKSEFFIQHAQPLKSVIHSFWQTCGFTPFQKENIIPLGIVEMIFNFSNTLDIKAQIGAHSCQINKCFINGYNTAPIKLLLPEHQFFFGVRLQPFGAQNILKVPASEFCNSLVDLTLVDAGMLSLWHQLAEQDNFANRVTIFSEWAEKHLTDVTPREKLINSFLVTENQHSLPVEKLAGLVCYSPRHLSRKLVENTGLNTEEILIYKKYMHALKLIHHTPLSLTEISYRSHFSDQPHFIRTFKKLSAMTPGAYRRNKSFMQGHLYENVR